MHRDLKTSNLLLSADGQLKIADFGLACVVSSDESARYSHAVASRWYRAPELLYGANSYGPAVDVWGAGMVFAEILGERQCPLHEPGGQLCWCCCTRHCYLQTFVLPPFIESQGFQQQG